MIPHDQITVVLTNWARPGNLAAICGAFRAQNHDTFSKVEVWLVDNAPQPYKGPAEFDRVIRIEQDAGPCCRFAALPHIERGAVLLHDDDAAPSPGAFWALRTSALHLDWNFASLGEIGRYASRSGDQWSLVRKNVRREPFIVKPVDVLCRSHFFLAEHAQGCLNLRRMAEYECSPEMLRHDDIFLSLGLQFATARPSYLLKGELGRRLLHRELDDSNAQNARPGHNGSRSQLVTLCHKIGWRPKR